MPSCTSPALWWCRPARLSHRGSLMLSLPLLPARGQQDARLAFQASEPLPTAAATEQFTALFPATNLSLQMMNRSCRIPAPQSHLVGRVGSAHRRLRDSRATLAAPCTAPGHSGCVPSSPTPTPAPSARLCHSPSHRAQKKQGGWLVAPGSPMVSDRMLSKAWLLERVQHTGPGQRTL